MNRFGPKLQRIMTRNGLSQRELARRAGIDYVSLCRMLKPSYAFSPGKTIDRITQAVGCTADERIELYRLAGIVPPEVVKAFSRSQKAAARIMEAAE